MNKTIYIFINGILNMPSDTDAWTDRAVTWVHIHTGMHAEKYEYFSPVMLRRFRQQDRAETLARMIKYYHDWDVVMVAHSNGCDVVMRTLAILKDKNMKELHFIAPACSRQVLYQMRLLVDTERLEKFQIFLGGKDRAMKWAAWSQKILGPFGIGYGDLGGEDPVMVGKIIGEENVIFEPQFDHSTWFEKAHFEGTMKKLVGATDK